jgi:hypothetical protein
LVHGKESKVKDGDTMRFFNDNLSDMRGLPRINYKGGKETTTKKIIAPQTAEEKRLQDSSIGYANSTMGTANNMMGNINNTANDYKGMYSNYNNTADTVRNGYTGLLNGQLPQQYQQARQQALNSDLVGTFGNAVSGMGSRGVINSSVMGGALDGINRNASDTLARNYSSDMGQYAGLLGSTAQNNNNNMSNYNSNLSSQINNSGNLANNTSGLFGTMWNGRYGTAGTKTTESGGGFMDFLAAGAKAYSSSQGG